MVNWRSVATLVKRTVTIRRATVRDAAAAHNEMAQRTTNRNFHEEENNKQRSADNVVAPPRRRRGNSTCSPDHRYSAPKLRLNEGEARTKAEPAIVSRFTFRRTTGYGEVWQPSDNSLAVWSRSHRPDRPNTPMAIYSKKGKVKCCRSVRRTRWLEVELEQDGDAGVMMRYDQFATGSVEL